LSAIILQVVLGNILSRPATIWSHASGYLNLSITRKSASLDSRQALTREAATHSFRSGRIDAAFVAGIVTAMKMPLHQVLICGSNLFVEAAAEMTMAAGIDAALIKTERYGV
jgi:ferredoxin-NADP reductase